MTTPAVETGTTATTKQAGTTDRSAGVGPLVGVGSEVVRSVRARILAWVIVLTALGMAGAAGTAYLLETQRIDARIDRSLQQEIAEFAEFHRTGVDPATGQPFASVDRLLLTARDSVDDTVAGLEGGADDYIAKPFRFEELLARIRLRLRDDRGAEPTVLRCGDLTLDLRTRRASAAGRVVELTAREFVLVEMFLRNPGQVLSRQQLLSHIWGYDFDPGSNIVDVYIRYLRKKLGAERIETVRGMGYRLADSSN